VGKVLGITELEVDFSGCCSRITMALCTFEVVNFHSLATQILFHL